MQRADHVIDRRLAIHEMVAGGYLLRCAAQTDGGNHRLPGKHQPLRSGNGQKRIGLACERGRLVDQSHDPQHLRTHLDVVTNGPPQRGRHGNLTGIRRRPPRSD